MGLCGAAPTRYVADDVSGLVGQPLVAGPSGDQREPVCDFAVDIWLRRDFTEKLRPAAIPGLVRPPRPRAWSIRTRRESLAGSLIFVAS